MSCPQLSVCRQVKCNAGLSYLCSLAQSLPSKTFSARVCVQLAVLICIFVQILHCSWPRPAYFSLNVVALMGQRRGRTSSHHTYRTHAASKTLTTVAEIATGTLWLATMHSTNRCVLHLWGSISIYSCFNDQIKEYRCRGWGHGYPR